MLLKMVNNPIDAEDRPLKPSERLSGVSTAYATLCIQHMAFMIATNNCIILSENNLPDPGKSGQGYHGYNDGQYPVRSPDPEETLS